MCFKWCSVLLVGSGLLLFTNAQSPDSTPSDDESSTAPGVVQTNTSLLMPPVSGRVPNHYKFRIDKSDVFFDTKVIPEDHEVAAFLYKGETKLFFFLNERETSTLSISVTPCTSSLEWSVKFRPQNLTGILKDSENSSVGEEELETYHGGQQQTYRTVNAKRGLYVVRVRPLERETYVHFYASRSEAIPEQDLQFSQAKLRVSPRQQRRRLVIRWEPSSVDPHLMHYCLVVNTRRDYPTLCAAKGDRYGVSPPDYPTRAGFDFPKDRQESQKSELASKAARRQAGALQGRFNDMVVGCVGKKTHYSLGGLQHGKVYHFNLFATNKKTKLSFPYASTTVKYDKKSPKQSGLRDGKPVTVNFRQLDGLATFKFKIGPGVPEAQFFVLPCGGGSVFAEVLFGKRKVIEKQRVDSFGRLRLPNPVQGRYVLRVTSTDPEELRRIAGLQVFATSRSDSSPLPELPTTVALHEYPGLRSCDSVTIAWLPSPDPHISRYCVQVRDETRQKQLFFKKPNQCHLPDTPSKHRDLSIVSNNCFDHPKNVTQKVITQRIGNLRPGRNYVVQVTIRKPKGRPLSYDLFQVHTKSKCMSKFGSEQQRPPS